MKLTLKQKKFVKKYLETGNATKAALEVYNTKNYNSAHAIAAENLQKPTIQKEIEQALEANGLTDTYISDLLRKAVESGLGIKPTNADSLRGLDMMLKLKGAYPPSTQKSAHLRIEMKEDIAKKDYQEIKHDLEKLNMRTQELLSLMQTS